MAKMRKLGYAHKSAWFEPFHYFWQRRQVCSYRGAV